MELAKKTYDLPSAGWITRKAVVMSFSLSPDA